MSTPPTPSPAQLAWQRMETNLFIHFGMNTFTDREWGVGTESPAQFQPTALDCRQWARVARQAGFRTAILTAKHHDGFCLWPTATTTHSVASSPWREGRGDLVREFVEAFRAEGLHVGLYLSPWDRHEPCYGSGAGYNDFYCRQLTELLTQYGDLHEVWFDGAFDDGPGVVPQVYDWARIFALVRELQPGAVTFGDGGTDVRWVGNERGFAGETCWSTIDDDALRFPGDSGISQANDARADADKERILNEGHDPTYPARLAWRPAECDVSIRPGWFYHTGEDAAVRSVENLLDLYLASVGRNGTLLLNIPPTPAGLFHEIDAERVTEFRRRLDEMFAHDLTGGATPARTRGDSSGYVYTTPLPGLEEAALIVLGEGIASGQVINAHRVELQDADGTWAEVARGTTIGHKRIHRFPPRAADAVRVTVHSAVGDPILSALSVYPAAEG